MEFEDNWDLSPWQDSMYEPVLKLRMRDMAGSMRGSSPDDSAFVVKYDPSIVKGHYSRPPNTEEREFNSKYYGLFVQEGRMTQQEFEKVVNKPLPYDSPQARNILQGVSDNNRFAATKTLVGATLRLKAYGRFGDQSSRPEILLESYNYALSYIKEGNFPIISDDPQKTVLYIYRNYIRMPALNPVDYEGRRSFEGVRNIEICLHAVVITKVFNLHLQDYVEVEPHWHRLAHIEVSA